MRAIPLNQSTAEFKNVLTSAALAIGDVVAINVSGVAVKADKSNSNLVNAVGFVMVASAGSALVTIPVRNKGIIANPAWNFISGKPVYLSNNGAVTQTFSSIQPTDWTVELGIAIGVNQIDVNIRQPIGKVIAAAEPHAVDSDAVIAYVAAADIAGRDYL
jgi:hypothetical protein